MSHWGKLFGIGLGYFVADIPGAIFGLVLGFIADACFFALRKPRFSQLLPEQIPQLQKEFFVATFTVMGHIAAAGQPQNGDNMQSVFRVIDRLNLPEDIQEEAIRLYETGMSQNFNLNDVLLPFFTTCRLQKHMLEMFVELQMYSAIKDGKLGENETIILQDICSALEISKSEFDRLMSIIRAEQHFRRNPEQTKSYAGKSTQAKSTAPAPQPGESSNLIDAYAILNIPPHASDEEIKQAYRRMRSMHHPDKLQAKGLSEEMLKIAEDRTRQIRMAYERIRAVRHF